LKKGLWLILVILSVFAYKSGFAGSEPSGETLKKYVAKQDASYGYFVKRIVDRETFSYAEIILTSQTWKNIVWKHQMYIIKPKTAENNVRHALMLIDGGQWNRSYERTDTNAMAAKYDQKFEMLATLANHAKTPVVVLRHVPHQALWGMKEDALIAYTFDKYIQTGDSEWPLLLPMVKSATRAIDAAQDFSRNQWSLSLETFTVTGSSKRGWATWLTGAVDKRVTAIAPMVIDILNMKAQMEHQKAVLGDYSEQISEYTSFSLQARLETPSGKTLQNMVDPYSYREDITQPKLIILGTNDRYWTLDALNLYWKELAGLKYILYMPNEGHGLRNYKKVMGSINALHQHAAFGTPLPKLDWEHKISKGKISFTIKSGIAPNRVRAWTAYAPTKNFHGAQWESQSVRTKKSGYVYRTEIPQDKCLAVFLEMEYESLTLPYYFSTNVLIAGPPHCM